MQYNLVGSQEMGSVVFHDPNGVLIGSVVQVNLGNQTTIWRSTVTQKDYMNFYLAINESKKALDARLTLLLG